MRNRPFIRARRAFVSFGLLGMAITLGAMFMTAMRMRDLDEGATETALVGITFFTAERGIENGATTASLRPGLGVLLLVVVIPAATAAFVYFRSKPTSREVAESS